MTSEVVSCPKCGELVSPKTQICEHCGVNLALAALLAERKLTTGSLSGGKMPFSPEILVPLLGNFLIEKQVLSSENLEKALQHQTQLGKAGKTQLIGKTLVDLGFISKGTLDRAITEQIIELHSALQKANFELEDRVRERTQDLENALSRLAELNQLKSNFLANISHELRTPLTHIRGYVELLIEGELGPLTDEQTSALDVMKQSEERLEQLIEDLIQFSLVAKGDIGLIIEKAELQWILDAVISEAIKKFKKSGLEFKTKIPKNLPMMDVDHQKIIWVLLQLIDNSIKFTSEGGVVELKVLQQKGEVTISVIDSGIGIEENRLEEIFEPFHQLDGSATRRYGGTGLGLAMVKEIIEAHGSNIIVKSKANVGTYIGFSLTISA